MTRHEAAEIIKANWPDSGNSYSTLRDALSVALAALRAEPPTPAPADLAERVVRELYGDSNVARLFSRQQVRDAIIGAWTPTAPVDTPPRVMDMLLIEVAGLLRMIAEGYRPINLSDQARDLFGKVGARLVEPTPTGWQPIVTAPKDRAVLLCIDDGDVVVGYWHAYYSWWMDTIEDGDVTRRSRGEPTHWHYLPEPPQ